MLRPVELARRFVKTEATSQHHTVWELSSVVEESAKRPVQPVTLQYLVELGEKHSVLESARYVHSELPKRLSRRVKGRSTVDYVSLTPSYSKSALYRRCESAHQERLSALSRLVQSAQTVPCNNG